MKKSFTELVFIIDKSASMRGLEEETLNGFNSMIKEQQALEGEALVTTILFDANCTVIHNRVNIKDIKPLTRADYYIGRGTAMNDAIGIAMHRIRKAQNGAEKTMFIIITDGEENSSRHYTGEMIRERILRYKKAGWEFVLFGANIDAAAEAAKIGISADHVKNYSSDIYGTRSAYTAMSAVSTAFRSNEPVGFEQPDNIKDALENAKNALRGVQGALDGLVNEAAEINRIAEANGGKIPDLNEIIRNILEGHDGGNE